MITDYEQELTAAGGELFTAANTYGDKPYDMKAAGDDPAVGEPLKCYWEITDDDSDVGTNQTIELVSDDDGAGTNEVSLLSSGAVVAASLTKGTLHLLGVVPPGLVAATNKYLNLKVTTSGADPTVGKIRAFLSKADLVAPYNQGVKVG